MGYIFGINWDEGGWEDTMGTFGRTKQFGFSFSHWGRGGNAPDTGTGASPLVLKALSPELKLCLWLWERMRWAQETNAFIFMVLPGIFNSHLL